MVKQCKIFAVEIGFNPIFCEQDELDKTCLDIWNHPGKYSDFKDGSESAYYRFLKYLWVEIDGNGKQLGEYVTELEATDV